MLFANVKALSIPQGVVTKVEAGGKILWQAAVYKNWARYSTDADGKTIYNGGLGYKNGYRLSSSGGESASVYNAVTGFIPASGGDVVRIKGYTWYDTASSTNYFNAYDSGFVFKYAANSRGGYQSSKLIKSMYLDGDVSVVEINDNVDIAYIRISVYNSSKPDGANLIITINEEITD